MIDLRELYNLCHVEGTGFTVRLFPEGFTLQWRWGSLRYDYNRAFSWAELYDFAGDWRDLIKREVEFVRKNV